MPSGPMPGVVHSNPRSLDDHQRLGFRRPLLDTGGAGFPTSRTLARDDGSRGHSPHRPIIGQGDVKIVAKQVLGIEAVFGGPRFSKQPTAAGPALDTFYPLRGR